MENSPLSHIYALFKNTPVIFQAGNFVINKPLLLWINDGLMAIFFLTIGLEIKREIIEGNLSKPSQVILPVLAAIFGVLCPSLIYSYINFGTPAIHGWAVPAATDIAFSLGILTLLGDKVPKTLKITLVAIAVIDDLLAIIIIALFYTAEISTLSLILAFIGLAFAILLNKKGVTRLSPYVVLGLFIWGCVLKSGVHATLAGVALGLIIPLKVNNKYGFPPAKTLEDTLHPWVAFFILPIFAFANAGLSLKGLSLEDITHPISLGIMLGLFFGKQIGIMGLTFIVTRLKICSLPKGVNWLQYYGMALLTGVGFTMSLFIGTLAFKNIENLYSVRLGVLSGTILSSIAGIIVLTISNRINAKKNKVKKNEV
ncbi:MAG: Na(+)/H(+) antiporter NhaA [Alphaproteobacteria bacterium ADurb.Bin438]|nr:MAG: Na(+)/H(+) antiporter NhaA [Alphaproteobacteria bacterium ADurb.Bin438]